MMAVGSRNLDTVGMRRLVDGVTLGLAVATFARVADYEILLQALLVIIGIGAVLYGFTAAVARIVLVGGAALLYSVVAMGVGDPLEADAFDFADYAEWPLMGSIALIVAFLADRIGSATRRYAALYREASERLLTAQEEERGRLARDLHDGVGQTLTAVILTLDAAESELASGSPSARDGARSSIQRAKDLAASALDEARDVAARLRPARIHEIGLGAALVNLARAAGAPVDVRFDAALLPPGLLDEASEIDVYRIAQEAISNAARHGHATLIWLDASVHDSWIRIEVGDDGRGMDPQPVGDGLGIAGMQERASILRATLDIRSRPGSGTVVELSIPLPAERAAAHRPAAAFVDAETRV